MSRRARLVWLSVVVLAAAGLGVAALAWACTPQAYISLSPSSGPPGTVVTVTGSRFVADGRVELRLNSVDSAPVATATGPSFSVQVTIPQDVQPGATVLIGATGYDQDGQAVSQPATGYRVAGPAAAAPAPAPATTAPAARPAPKQATAPATTSAPHATTPQHRPAAVAPSRHAPARAAPAPQASPAPAAATPHTAPATTRHAVTANGAPVAVTPPAPAARAEL